MPRMETKAVSRLVEIVCRRTMRRPAPAKNLGFLGCRSSGKRPWRAFSTDREMALTRHTTRRSRLCPTCSRLLCEQRKNGRTLMNLTTKLRR
jgi:hypothetical protein